MVASKTISSALKGLARLAGVLLLTAMVAAGPATAEGRGRDHGREGRGEGRWSREEGPDRRGPPGRYRDAPPPYAYGPPRYYAPYMGPPAYQQRQGPPAFALRRGGLVPPQYRGAIVPDYGRYRLRPPPPGFAWVRLGDRYMLVSRATGQIFDVIGD